MALDNSLQALGDLVQRIYETALKKPDSCGEYADLCCGLSVYMFDSLENGKLKKLLLNKCQEEFEIKQRDGESVVKQSKKGRVEARRRMMGNIRFIGELFKKKMLTEWIMHDCINTLLGQHRTVDEEDIEALCLLMSTVGEVIDHPKSKEKMEVYFEKMRNLSNNIELSSSVRVTLKDLIDLRENNWKPSHDTSSNQPTRSNSPMTYQSLDIDEDLTKVLSLQKLEAKSSEVIEEFYSNCYSAIRKVSIRIKELNTPSFNPTMVSIWITQSFEAKEDIERDLLAKLLVDLTTSDNATLSPTQLVKGFESVLQILEDLVVDVPEATNYLSRIFAKVVMEGVVSLRDIAQIILASGEEPGSLLNSGLAGEILGSMLTIIKSEKGSYASKELVKGARLRLENFRPPEPRKSETLDKFILGLVLGSGGDCRGRSLKEVVSGGGSSGWWCSSSRGWVQRDGGPERSWDKQVLAWGEE